MLKKWKKRQKKQLVLFMMVIIGMKGRKTLFGVPVDIACDTNKVFSFPSFWKITDLTVSIAFYPIYEKSGSV